ncbi:MAG: tellurite resistance protein TerC [Nitriliruptoraceae bacterium]|jgi:tellurite resistance protein TerC
MLTVLATEAAGTTARFVDLDIHAWQWAALVVTIVALLLVDVLLVHRTPHEISVREALIESSVWVAISVLFGVLMGVWFGWPASGEYFGGYLIEKSLSIDNVFVWAVIFGYFKIPTRYQFRVLMWGVFGALVLRAIFIFAGVALLDQFSWLLYVFGALLLFTAYRLVRDSEHELDPATNPIMRMIRRVVPSTDVIDGQKMFTRIDGKLLATPLFAVLLLVEFTDVIFAVDSVPAILAISREPFIVFSANAFAILGLRALYFALAGMKDRFRYLDRGLAAILTFVGVKMLLLDIVHVPTSISLAVIACILAVAVATSLRASRRDDNEDNDVDAAVQPQQPTDAEMDAL